MYKGLTDDLVTAYDQVEKPDREVIDQICSLLGSQGVEILSKALSECEDRQARKAATDALIQQGEKARQWVLKALVKPDQPWYFLRNALMILRYVGKGQKGIDVARNLLSYAHPRVRDEALHTLLTLGAPDAEQIVIDALDDPDDKVLWRATTALSELSPLSEASISRLVGIIKTEFPEEEQASAKHANKVSNVIRALGTMNNLKNIQPIEDAVLETAQLNSGQKKGILKRLKKSSSTHHDAVLSAAIATLGKIGTSRSEAFLDKLAAGKTPQAEPARKAVESIRERYAKQQAGTPANA